MVLIKTLPRPQSTMEYLYLILERKILLFYYCGRHRCLIILSFGNFAIVFTRLLRWQRQYLVVLKSLNGSWIQTWWCARNQAMLIYLVMTSLIFVGSSAYCFLRCYLAIMSSFRLFCRRLIANSTEDEPRGNVWHAWWTFLRERLGNVNGMSQAEYFINHCKLCDCNLFVCFVGIHI